MAASDNIDNIDEQTLKEIDEEIRQEERNKSKSSNRLNGVILLIGGIIGWIAAVELLMGKLFLLENPGASLSCDVNPLISCGSVMMTWQASAFGIPNMAIGLAGFAIMGVVGSLLLTKKIATVFPEWLRWATFGGMTFAFAFVHFLAISAIFFIHALCPWCMVVWAVVAPMFFSTVANLVEHKKWHNRYKILNVLRHWVLLTIGWYALVAITIFIVFFQQWMFMLGF